MIRAPLLTKHALDPKYEEEVSGCTACVGLITDDKIYIVGFPRDLLRFDTVC